MSNKGQVKVDYRDNLIGASFAFAGMNFMVDPADLPIEGGQCVDICNCDIDYVANVSRRNGFEKYIDGNITSSWANSEFIYVVKDGLIGRIVDNNIVYFTNSPSMLPLVEFKQVNNIVVYSDGVTIGIIDGDTLFVFSKTVEFG